MQTIINLLVFIVVLGSIIMIHELGHFIAAKAFGVYCGEFSLGMGPSLWHMKKGETTYHLRALPIGGYVAMAGEADQEDNESMKDVPFERTIKGIKTWKQVVVMSAGVFMNFVLAIVLLFGVNVTSGMISVDTNEVGKVLEDGVAMEIGIQEGDRILDVFFDKTNEHYAIESMTDLSKALAKATNGISDQSAEAVITYERNGESIEKAVTLPYNPDREAFYLGVQVPVRALTVQESFTYTISDIKEMSLMIFTTLGKLVTDSKNTISQLSGPAGIYQVTSEVTEAGQFTTLIALVAALSVNVGIFNLLPIPGLDGSQILFALIEKAMGRPISTNVRYYLQLAGLILVFGLMIIVTIQDVTRMF